MTAWIPMPAAWGVLFLAAFLVPKAAGAHCDTLNGPVVTAAKIALESGDPTPVLKWVREEDEPEIRKVFEKSLAVRKLSSQARDVADLYFFETLVRVHRAGEGVPYTGLKSAGTVDPAIAMSDEALAKGTVDALVQKMSETVAAGLRARFEHALTARKQADSSVLAGREYVAAYVEFVHYAERVHQDAASAAGGHDEASTGPPPRHAHD